MKYLNPVIKGFNPDPSICRVGNDYYLVTSTFEYFPAIPVYHSTDLINWEITGHCIDRPEQLPLDMARPSGGVWAPTIRYDNGTFYVTATFSERGNFIISSKNPAGGYSNPVLMEMDGIDPSVFFENGEMYYCTNDCGSRSKNGEGISVAKVNPQTGKVTGEIKRVWQGTGNGWLEAPHIYHIGDYYYLMAAEGGSGWGHMTTEARSRSIWGPYEACPLNPILTNRNDTSKQVLECGHADLVRDGNGNYFIVHLGTRPSAGSMTNLGRETFLMPVKFENGWFYVEGGRSRLEVEADIKTGQKSKKEITVDFTNPVWEKEWLFIGAPNMENYKRGNGPLVLRAQDKKFGQSGSTFAAMRQPDFECEMYATMESTQPNLKYGLTAYLAPDFAYRIYTDGKCIIADKLIGDMYAVVHRQQTEENRVIFFIKADREKYRLGYTINSKTVCAAEGTVRFLCTAVAGKCFTGTLMGMFAQGDGDVTVRDFSIKQGA